MPGHTMYRGPRAWKQVALLRFTLLLHSGKARQPAAKQSKAMHAHAPEKLPAHLAM